MLSKDQKCTTGLEFPAEALNTKKTSKNGVLGAMFKKMFNIEIESELKKNLFNKKFYLIYVKG